jgi:methylated-DNA-[protein]-cysteine S-methyltransferase
MPLLSGLKRRTICAYEWFFFFILFKFFVYFAITLCSNLFKIMETVYIKTPLGIATIIGDENGISVISVSDEGAISVEIPTVLQEAVSQLNDYFDGKRTDFEFKLNPKGTEFQQKVWKALLEIPYGKTRTYLQQSKIIGDVKAIRAVASANGKNPLWIVVPCHRVIGTDGSLTGYAGGLWRKKWLLEHENPTTQQSLF